jgi:hypothetical protein
MKKPFELLFLLQLSIIIMAGSCQKKNEPTPTTLNQTNSNSSSNSNSKLDTIYNPVDPILSSSIGFFLDDWQPKTFVIPSSNDVSAANSPTTDTINIDLNNVLTKVPKYLFGNNVNSWMGQMVDGTGSNPKLMGYLSDLSPNVLRFPGGSISDMYFWNSPVNTPPADVATTIYNSGQSQTVTASSYWYGTHPTSDNWTISLDSYYKVLQQANSTGMITINYGYARYGKGTNPVATAAHLAADWVRYDKGRSKYWEIGNESSGSWEAGYQINISDNKDGQPQIITGTVYGQHFKVFADSMRKAAQEVGVTIKIGAQVIGNPQANSGTTDWTWNNNMFSAMGDYADFFIVHNYYAPWHQNSTASVILNSALSETKAISSYLATNTSSNHVQMKPIAMTEWNIESEGSKQKVSAVAGMHAVLCVGEMVSHNFGQASRWDLANAWSSGNDHGLFNNSGLSDVEPGASPWNPRPAFYYLYFMQKYLGDRLVTTAVSPSSSDLTAYSSTFTSGQAGTIIVNRGTASRTTLVNINHFNAGKKCYWHMLIPGSDNGEFSGQVLVNNVNPTGATGGPLNYSSITPYSTSISSGSFKVSVPPRAIIYLVVDKK